MSQRFQSVTSLTSGKPKFIFSDLFRASSFFTVILFAAQFSNVPCFANSIQIYITVLKYFG